MDIFSNQAGAVVALPSPGIPMAMFLQGWGGYVPFKSIITGFTYQGQSGVQVSHNLRSFIDIYVFGERISPVTISGVSFAFVCERLDEALTNPFTGQTAFVPNYHGLEYVMAYYNAFRVSATGAPVTMVFGLSTVIFGFLKDLSIQLVDADHSLANFSMNFLGIPQANLIPLLPA